MTPSLAEIEAQIKRVAVHYPEAGHNGATIKILAEDWAEDLKVHSISQDTFAAALKVCRRECQFFPKISEVLAAAKTVDSYKASRPIYGQLQLEEGGQLTDAECLRNKRRLEALLSGLESEMREEDLLQAILNIQ